MAKPRVFVSSTFYDLKHIRSSLEHFIESLGYEAILSEEGNIPYRPDRPLDESCYLEAEHADIFVLIVGGRYGSAASEEKKEKLMYGKDITKIDNFYTSIPRKEYETASKNIPTYIFIDKFVYAEYYTYLKNKNSNNTIYVHVDSVNVFHFIDFIRSRPLNNPIQTFDNHTDIQSWLKEQWAGLFRDFLHEQSTRTRFFRLEEQISGLSTISDTLKTYLESIITHSKNVDAESLIASENKRIIEIATSSAIDRCILLQVTKDMLSLTNNKILEAIKTSETLDSTISNLGLDMNFYNGLGDNVKQQFIVSINEIRSIHNLSPFPSPESLTPSDQE